MSMTSTYTLHSRMLMTSTYTNVVFVYSTNYSSNLEGSTSVHYHLTSRSDSSLKKSRSDSIPF